MEIAGGEMGPEQNPAGVVPVMLVSKPRKNILAGDCLIYRVIGIKASQIVFGISRISAGL